ncbi:MAG: hypothetical protein Q8P28_07965 [Deltaproteobacteria bacterium]|nr:hypothetical protein [Deltaproteobacteria bacterium]
MWNKLGIGIFFIVATAAFTFGIIGLSSLMERLYKRNNRNK